MRTSNMENGLLNVVILLDLRKTFDLVDTDGFLKNLFTNVLTTHWNGLGPTDRVDSNISTLTVELLSL